MCGASKLQLSHPLNKRNYIPTYEQAKKVSFIPIQRGPHSWQNTSEFTMKVNVKASYYEIIDTIQSEFSHRFLEFNVSHQIFACLFTSIELLSRQGRIATSLLFSQFNYQKYQWRSSPSWKYYCEKHRLIKASWCDFERKHPYEFGPVFEMVLEVQYKAAFPTIYLLLSAGLTVGFPTATCEPSFSSVVRILRPCRRCMAHDRTVV